MGKIFRLNKNGTSGVSISKTMKDAGYVIGIDTEWVSVTGGFLLRIVPKKEIVETTPVLETL
jgi:hypothetical protein